MDTRTLFPRLLVVAAALVFSGAVVAQSSEAETKQPNTTITAIASPRLEAAPVAPNTSEERRPRTVTPVIDSRPAPILPGVPTVNLATSFDQSLLTAMQSHLGSSYRFNRTGPEQFDCSGFVWRAFQDIGVTFQRGPARSYWATMPAPTAGEQFKFGTLVFFSNLRHVGIVVDEKGFYHSARHGGVMYSPFNEYWLSRIDGFRRVPLSTITPAANSKKPATPVSAVDENNEP